MQGSGEALQTMCRGGSPLSLRRMGVPPPIPCASIAEPAAQQDGGCILSDAAAVSTRKQSEAAPPFALAGTMQFRAREQRRNTGFQPVRSAGFPACQMAWWRSLNGERLSQAGSPLTAQAGSPHSASRPPRQLHRSGLGSGESRLYTVGRELAYGERRLRRLIRIDFPPDRPRTFAYSHRDPASGLQQLRHYGKVHADRGL